MVYGLPTVGGDKGKWAGKLNASIAAIKTLVDDATSALEGKADTAALTAEAATRDTADQALATVISDYATSLNTALGTKASTTALNTETTTRTDVDATKTDDPFRFDSTRGRAFKAALGKRDSTPVDILTVGASWLAGSGAGSTVARFADVSLGQIRTKWQPAGVTGGLGYRESFSFTPGYTTPYTFAGTGVAQSTLGLGRKVFRMSAAATVSFTSPGTAVDIVFGKGTSGGTFTYQINGGTASAVQNTVAASTSDATLRITTTPGDVVKITVGSNYFYFEGVMFYNGDETKGLRMWNGATSGYRTTDFIDGLGVSYGAWGLVDPDLVIIGDLVANDYSGGTSLTPVPVATSATQLAAIYAAIRAKCTRPPTIVQMLMPQITNGAVTTLAPWADYRQMVKDVAKADGSIVLWDVAPIFGTMTGTDTYAIINGDQAHPNVAGHKAVADSLTALLASI